MAKEFVIKHGLIVHGEITGSDVRIDDWNSISASLAELNSNVSETVTTASIVGNVITFTKSDGTTFDTVVQEDTGSFFTSASVDLNTITFHYGDNTSGSLSVETGTTLIRVKNTSGGAISKGTPVYITGNVGATDMLQIAPADASDASKMPAVGLLLADLGINGEGFVVQGGYLTGMVTDTIDGTSTTSNDTVYVKAGGGLTMTKPTGDTNYIQNIAKVARVHGTAGSFIVSSILRTNDVPNLPTGKIWVGDGNTVTSSFVHLDETNQRMGIGTDTPLKPLHIENESVPVRLESDTHNAVVVNYRTDEVGTGNGIQVGARGASDFFVQQDVVSGGSSQWNVNVYVSQSGKVYLPNLDGGLDDLILYYNNETGELKPGAQPSTGSFFTSASVDYNRVTFTSGDGTTSTITIDTGSFEPDRQDTGSFFTSASVDLNTITFTQGDGTTEVITVHTGSAAGSDRWIQFNHEGSFGASHYLNYSGNRLNIDSRTSAPALKLSASLNNASVINFRAQNTVNNGIQVGSRGTNDFFVQQDSTVDNNPSQWNLNLYISQSGEIFAENLATATTSNTLYYNTTTGEVTYGAVADTGSYYVSSSNSQDNLRLFQADGTSVSHDIYDPRNYVSSSVDLNRITFTQRGGTTEVVTIHTGSGATPGTPLNSFQFNSGSEFRGSTLFFDDTTKQVGINTSASAATLHVRGADNTTGSLLIETDSVGIAERAFASLDFRVADNDGTGYRKFAIIAENTGTNFGYGQLHFALNDSNNTSNARIADSKLTIDRTGRIYMPDLAPITKTDIVYYNTGTGEVSYGAAPAATDISALNTFTGSLQTEVNDLKAATGSYYVSSSVDLNRITFTQADGSTEVVTVHTGSAGGGGGLVSAITNGADNRIATFTGTDSLNGEANLTFDGDIFAVNTSDLYVSASKVGIGTTNPARPLHINSTNAVPIRLSSTTANRQAIQYFGTNSNGAGVIVGTEGENDFIVLQSDFLTSTVNKNLYVSESGEAYLPRLGTSTTSDVVYYDSTTGELTYGSAPSGGTDTTIYSTNGTLSGNRTLTGGSNSLTFTGLSSFSVENSSAINFEGPIYLSSITNATKSDVLYLDTTTGEVTYGTAPGGGSGTPGGSTTQVQFNDGGSFGGDAGLVYDKTNDRLGIGGTGTPTNTLHLAGDSEALYLDGSTGTQTSQYLKISTDGTGADYRLGLGYTSPTNVFTIDNYNGSSWDTHFKIHEAGYVDLPSLQSATTSNVIYYDTASGRLSYGTAPGGGSGTPGGSTTQVQFNDGGSFGGDAGLVYDKTNDRLGIGGTTPTTTLHLGKQETPLLLDGDAASQKYQYIEMKPDGSGAKSYRFGAGFSSTSPVADGLYFDYTADGSTWTTRLRIEGAGQGTSTPGALTLSGYAGASLAATADTSYILSSDSNGKIWKVPLQYDQSAGAYGIGTTNPSSGKLHVNGSVGSGQVSIYASHNIQAAGNLYANTRAHIGGTTSPTSGVLQVTGNASGTSIYASHDIVAYSDARSKVNVETIPNALEKVNAVRGVTYNKVEDPEGIRYMGVIAQELLEHLPEVVHQGEEGNYSVAYGNVVGVLIEAVKELTAKVEDLESRLGK